MKIISQMDLKIIPPPQNTHYILGTDLLPNLHRIQKLKGKNYHQFLLLTDKNIFKLYGQKVISSLEKLGKLVIPSVILAGEARKNIKELSQIITPYFKKGFGQKACLVALGGGVIGDIGGFLSSILLRGIDSLSLPTTLLAQVDASIGGKTGVDFWLNQRVMYKNMIGTFKQPSLVITDVDVLKTLPQKEILNGLAEMVKYWIGWGKPTIDQLLTIKYLKPQDTPGVTRRGSPGVERSEDSSEVEELVKTIFLCQQIKIDIIEKDPFDTFHIREKLNLGHTIGHAVEGSSEGKLSHGESVAIGLVAAARISVLKNLLRKEIYDLIVKTIQSLELPVSIRNLYMEKVLACLKLDKKGGTFVLIKDIGQLETNVIIEKNIIKQVLEEVII